ncbi:YfcE family phosphodiesterase [Selenomonas sp. oral taxon 126]|uniref:YfcE family phosphodiesterase n=1 Tax=Selenomonas sp. oral taxon 126 TaxID=712528 RepID=UPI0008078880|nr:metallophosphoesterase [Selenomonas sp. oral taxon 126]ANR70984.1 YfcE family phosphodiesterase [Selenomonas sp. oral taxon 126]
MRIGIVSDSHGNTDVFEDMLAVPGAAEAELWLHAGDFAPDADVLEEMSGKRVARVLGNCDFFVDGVHDETVVEVAGHRIFLTHGHLFNVRFDTAMLAAAARETGADIAVYGHTHIALEEYGDVTVLNPGSIARPRDERRGSFMLVELNAGESPLVNLIRI